MSTISVDGMNIQITAGRIYVNGTEYGPKGPGPKAGQGVRSETSTIEDVDDGKRMILDRDAIVEAVSGNLYVTAPGGNVSVKVLGDVGGKVDAGGSVTVQGSVGKNVDAGGSVTVKGGVQGSIDAGGSVTIEGTATGKIDAGGSVSIRDVRM